jgi:hypothetical protein
MKFLQRLFHWDADQSAFEKGLTIVLALGFIFAVVFLIVVSYGVGHTDVANNHRAGGSTGWATFFFIVSGVWTWGVFSDKVPFKVNETLSIILCLTFFALGLLFNVGWDAHTYYPH